MGMVDAQPRGCPESCLPALGPHAEEGELPPTVEALGPARDPQGRQWG